jgi:CheY-like chemotaxis protein
MTAIKTRVLVVDDEPDTLNLLKMMLEISGYETVTTLNSTDVVALVEIENPDIALLDVMMPKINGFDLCKLLRTNPRTQGLPIMFVTAYPAVDLAERSKDAGGDYIVHKPINFDFLFQAIPLVIELRQRINSATKRHHPPHAGPSQ